ncbi:MAG: DUF501 domain-containing protein [bacterium]|nr:DUF501 domain-containing protein [bacterium]
MDDREIVAVQIGRPSRAKTTTVNRCHLGLPVAVRVPPVLEDGTPFPTLYWLTCPLAVRRVSRIESNGGVKEMDRRADQDPEFRAALGKAHLRYARRRDALLPEGTEPKPKGGVAGTGSRVKCLHAHYADTLAGNINPVGDLVAPRVEPLDCPVPCVITSGPGFSRNPDWVEPDWVEPR